MSAADTAVTPNASLAEFDRTTSRWGQLTMGVALILSLAAPLYLVFFTDLGITAGMIWTAYLAVAAAFFVLWFVEPITYYPVLGPAAMYQAFMIGNIANKLLPSALVAQAAIGAKAGTKRGEFAALMAICGAAMVHVISMLLFVGILGTWLVSIIPTDIVDVARLYIFPAIIGAVLVQLVVTMKQPRVTVIAVVVAALVLFVLVPAVPALAKPATGVVVLITAVLAWFLRSRKTSATATTLVN
ncbi:hypothetical protein RCH21_002596 [Arthrobacter sp. PL16]|uniref:Uncharacterized protein n=1 Tax=Arthrobacter cheniae TaxID=1258888 RepID=A0A3A5M9G0_9MICC|nr:MULTISPECIES: hypothetical protein [Arthrobacter]MEC5200350.1 hypothetical protein [Arthrobacter sp. PL16]RJT78012.1 hypothetical protein D6T63_13755 [Arthrobacter cheniae]